MGRGLCRLEVKTKDCIIVFVNRFDIAYDFAIATRRAVAFSDKMLRVFATRGYLTSREIDALLRIKAERESRGQV